MITAIAWLRDFGTGFTQPQLFDCESELELQRWVLKLRGNVDLELAADWIGCLLAHRLGISSPEVQIADVPVDDLLTAPSSIQSWAKPGPAFASRWLETAVGDFADSMVLAVAEPDYLGQLYALDAWLEVLDRRKPEGTWNLLYDTSQGSLSVIDFGKSMTPAFARVPALEPEKVVAPAYPSHVLALASQEAALHSCDIIEAIPALDIEEVVSSVPVEWLDEVTRPALVQFLLDRRPGLRSICDAMNQGGSHG